MKSYKIVQLKGQPHGNHFLPFLFLNFSMSFLIAKVIAIQRGKNGVKGPSQNSQHADAAASHHPSPVIIPIR